VTDKATTMPSVYPDHDGQPDYGLHAGVLGPLKRWRNRYPPWRHQRHHRLRFPGVRAGRKRHVVCLPAGHRRDFPRRFCVRRFARLSASPGSLYTYTANTLPPIFGVAAAWGLLLAYLATGASVAGGAVYYAAFCCSSSFTGRRRHPLLAFVWESRDSSRGATSAVRELMLWMKLSPSAHPFIVLVCWSIISDCSSEITINSRSRALTSSLGPALVLAIFSFVGFESATTSASKRAIRCAPFLARAACGLDDGRILMLCAYSEGSGIPGESGKLGETTSRPHLAGGPGISRGSRHHMGAFISVFACVLALHHAAARVADAHAPRQAAPAFFERTKPPPWTPTGAVLVSAA